VRLGLLGQNDADESVIRYAFYNILDKENVLSRQSFIEVIESYFYVRY